MGKILKREDNPFTLRFSFVPPQYITRRQLTDDVIDDLTKMNPAFSCHFLTGVRGSGKSVMMAEIGRIISKMDDWITIDIENPKGNILDALARSLYRIPQLKALFVEAKVDLSVLGIGVTIERANLIASNEYDAIDFMLKVLDKANKKVLVMIDEVTYCDEIAEFSHALSSYSRSGYNIFVLMTGLKENIKAIKNDKSLTFLYRAKDHELEPLNITAIVASYEKTLQIERSQAEDMAWATKGYSFAFQVLGYLYWNELSKTTYDEINRNALLAEYDQYLAEFVYDKIWSELAVKEKEAMRAICIDETKEVKSIRNILGMDSSKFSVYRSRLLDKGLIDGSDYGKIKIKLPRFEEFVLLQRED